MFHVEQFGHLMEKYFLKNNIDFVRYVFNGLESDYLKWNRVINLSSIRDNEGFWEKHIIDCLCLASVIKNNFKETKQIYDIGSGGGFPAIVLAVVLDADVIAVDPVKKKCDFIDHVSRKYKLDNMKTFHGKFEELEEVVASDLIVSRALGRYEDLQKRFVDNNLLLMTTMQSLPLKYKTVFNEEYSFLFSNLGLSFFENHIICHS